MLVVFGGLPGTGKTTVARMLAARRRASYLRIDVIEQALRSAGVLSGDVGASGYSVGNGLAVSNLAIGQMVVVDCVNPVRESRIGWRDVASRAGASILEVEIICSDVVEHRRRVESRKPDINGHVLPDWDAVARHEYEPWITPHLVVDTARLSAVEAVAMVERAMDDGDVGHMRDVRTGTAGANVTDV